MSLQKWAALAALAVVPWCKTVWAVDHAGVFADPLGTRAREVKTPDKKSLMAIAAAGERLIAVGMRGLVIFSDNKGGSWQQAKMPVQCDLTAVSFVDRQQGWAVGHDGTIVHSADGGKSWQVQLDGRAAKRQFITHYQQRIARGEIFLRPHLQEIQRNYERGPTLPWLGVAMADARHGMVVGSFGNIAATDDGGKTWLPWLEHMDNKNYLNLNAIGYFAGVWLIAAEQGAVFRADNLAGQRFRRLDTGYRGSFFALTASPSTSYVFGSRGKIFKSSSKGATWQDVSLKIPLAIAAGAALPDGRVMLATTAGRIFVSDKDAGDIFHDVAVHAPDLFTGVLPVNNSLWLMSGLNGITKQNFAARESP